jgi:hypothetical protein
MKFIINRRHFLINAVFLSILVFFGLCIISVTISKVPFGSSRDEKRHALGELRQGTVVRQQVPVRKVIFADTLCYDILFATYKRTNPCTLKISLKQDEYSHFFNLDASNLKDNQFFPLCFPVKGLNEGQAMLEISSVNCVPTMSPTVWMTPHKPYGGSFYNGRQTQKGLIFKAYARRKPASFLKFAGSLGLFVIALSSIVFWRSLKCRELFSSWFDRWKASDSFFSKTQYDHRKIIFVCSLIAWTLAVVMATVSSRHGTHPDEGLHSVAASYYEVHHLPPVVGAPDSFYTYSRQYGVSYLNQKGIDYFLIGKFSAILKEVCSVDRIYLYRVFNLILFFALCLLMLYSANSLIFFPLIVTPQVWYIASYTNNDFFPFFLMMVLCFEFIDRNSFYRSAEKGEKSLLYALPAGFILGILSISKANYLIFFLFSTCYLFWKVLKFNDFNINSNLLFSTRSKSMFVIILCAVSVYSARAGFDIYQNGFNKKEKLRDVAHEVAINDSMAMGIKNEISPALPGLRLKDKGYSINNLIFDRGWINKSARSFFGVYGMMTIFAPKAYYYGISFVFCLFLLYVGTQLVFALRYENIILFAVSFIFMLGIIAASLHYSWTYDFQPQGRYLFPLLGILSVLFYEARQHLNRNITVLLFVLMFSFSFWSFVFVGLNEIQKII